MHPEAKDQVKVWFKCKIWRVSDTDSEKFRTVILKSFGQHSEKFRTLSGMFPE